MSFFLDVAESQDTGESQDSNASKPAVRKLMHEHDYLNRPRIQRECSSFIFTGSHARKEFSHSVAYSTAGVRQTRRAQDKAYLPHRMGCWAQQSIQHAISQNMGKNTQGHAQVRGLRARLLPAKREGALAARRCVDARRWAVCNHVASVLIGSACKTVG